MQIKLSIAFLCLLLLLDFSSCKRSGEIADKTNLGIEQLYIREADEIEILPKEKNSSSFFFDKEKMKINLTLPVTHSRAISKESFSATLKINSDSALNLISSLSDDDFELFPTDKIKVLDNLTVQKGKEGGDFDIELDLEGLEKFIGKTLVFVLQLEESKVYPINKKKDTKVFYFRYDDLLGDLTFVDDYLSQSFSRSYAHIEGPVKFEIVDDPQNYYNDASRIMRATEKEVNLTYDLKKIVNLLPFAEGFTGFQINLLAPNLEVRDLIEISYSLNNGQDYNSIKDLKINKIYIPELSNRTWINFFLQASLPDETTELRITLKDQFGKELPPSVPLLSRLEIFYLGGAPYNYQEPDKNDSLDPDVNSPIMLDLNCLNSHLETLQGFLINSDFGDNPGQYPMASINILENNIERINNTLLMIDHGEMMEQTEINQICISIDDVIENFQNSKNIFESMNGELEVRGEDGGYIDFGESEKFGLGGDNGFTIETWMKYNENSLYSGKIFGLISTFHFAGGDEQFFSGWTLNFLEGNIRITLGLENTADGGPNLLEIGASAPKNYGEWNHVAAVYDPLASQNNLKLYLNGQLVSQINRKEESYNPNSDRRMWAFSTPNNSGANFNGYLKRFRLWEAAKSSSEISDLMTNNINGSEKDLVCAWDFEEIVEDKNQIPDKTGSFMSKIIGSHEWHEQ